MPFEQHMYETNEVYRSWIDFPFSFVEPNIRNNAKGMRKPQLGALFTTLAYLVGEPSEPATVVMPTGTGKTDTIFCANFGRGFFENPNYRTVGCLTRSDFRKYGTAYELARYGRDSRKF